MKEVVGKHFARKLKSHQYFLHISRKSAIGNNYRFCKVCICNRPTVHFASSAFGIIQFTQFHEEPLENVDVNICQFGR